MKIWITGLLMVSLLGYPLVSNAWGLLGHRVIGGIAECYFSLKTKKALHDLLGNETVALASNWADFMKSDPRYDSLGSWHYINLPSGLSDQQLMERLKKDRSTNLFTKLNLCINQLKNKALDRNRQIFYLKMLIHLAGDVHQPMHVARGEDKGGNNIKLYWFNAPTNLHRVWDEHLLEFQQLSYSEYVKAINFPSEAETRKWQQQPVSQWIVESYHISEGLYEGVKPEERLSYPYNFSNVELLNQQLLKGGIRLAGLLNQIYSRN